MPSPTHSYGDIVYHQGAKMKVLGSYYKLSRWYYDLFYPEDRHVYTTVSTYITPCTEAPKLQAVKDVWDIHYNK